MDQIPQDKRRNLSKLFFAGNTNTLEEIPNLLKLDLNSLRAQLHETEKNMQIEGRLLNEFMRNRSLRKERGKIVALIKIAEFWMKNKIKRGEALSHLEKALLNFAAPTEADFIVVPELKRAMEIRDHLKKVKGEFTKDDYYLTLAEQYVEQNKAYRELFTKNLDVDLWKIQYWKEMDKTKEMLSKKVLRKGQKYVPIELVDEFGNLFRTDDMLKKGPLVLSFFVGTFCPYCVGEMCVLTDSLPQINALGASLVSVGPDISAIHYFRRLGVVGNLLLDPKMIHARKYNIVYKLTPLMEKYYADCGCHLDKFNGGNGWYAPIPATYIIDTSGKIVFEYVQLEYYDRLEPLKIIEVLTDLLDETLGGEGTPDEERGGYLDIEKQQSLMKAQELQFNHTTEVLDVAKKIEIDVGENRNPEKRPREMNVGSGCGCGAPCKKKQKTEE